MVDDVRDMDRVAPPIPPYPLLLYTRVLYNYKIVEITRVIHFRLFPVLDIHDIYIALGPLLSQQANFRVLGCSA